MTTVAAPVWQAFDPSAEAMAMARPANDDRNRERIERMKAAIGWRFMERAQHLQTRKRLVEQRWTEDYALYRGRPILHPALDKPDPAMAIAATGVRSEFSPRKVRAITRQTSARIAGALMPTDNRNWAIEPTPVPEFVGASRRSDDIGKEAQARMQEARDRAQTAERYIDDWLKECGYERECRRAIRDMCLWGVGVMKGPIPRYSAQKAKIAAAAFAGQQMMGVAGDPFWAPPQFKRVDPWTFFPDMDALEPDEWEDVFERQRIGLSQARRLQHIPGIDRAALLRAVETGPEPAGDTRTQTLRAYSADMSADDGSRFYLWERHGTVGLDELKEIMGRSQADPAYLSGVRDDLETQAPYVDALTEFSVRMLVMNGEVIHIAPPILSTGGIPYACVSLAPDDASIWGEGVPRLVQTTARTTIAAVKAIIDNAALASGPQVAIDTDAIEPMDGKYVLAPKKLWRIKRPLPPGAEPFKTYDIPCRTEHFQLIIALAEKLMNEEIGLPPIPTPEAAAQITQTGTGMALMMQAMDVVLMDMASDWDDAITSKLLTAAYQYLLDYLPDETAKGDMRIIPRGTRITAARAMNGQNVANFSAIWGATPAADALRWRDMARMDARERLIEPDRLIESEDEYQARIAQTPPAEDPKLTLEKFKAQWRTAVEELNAEAAKELAVLKANTEIMLAQARAETAERQLVAEGALQARADQSRAAQGEPAAPGGGGSL